MAGGLAERAVIAALHQGEPAGWVVADRRDPLVSPGCCRNPRTHTSRIAHSSSAAEADEVLVSSTVKDLAAGQRPGKAGLRNIAHRPTV
jgi:hypothetical protein